MANRVKEDEKNERIIRNLLKLPENRRCINCNSLGPQYVCTNFWTFVCTTCSGIHREFTHRVKSVSMAKFTSQEVASLQGGGNARAKEIFFKEWDSQRHSFPDSSNLEKLRDFIKHVFVDRRYTGERSFEKPPMVKKGEESYENRRVDTYQGGSRSPPYEDTYERRYIDRPSPGGRSDDSNFRYDEKRSPGYERENRQYGDNRRSPANPELVNDWRRDDRFGNGRRPEDRRISDGDSRSEGRSPDRQKDTGMSSPPIVRPVREILGDNVVPLRISEPPKANGFRAANDSAKTLGTVSSSSLGSTDGNPVEPKRETLGSLIDFDADPEPPAAAVVPQMQQTTLNQSIAQPISSSGDNNWASFDLATEAKVSQAPSSVNSLESVLLQLSGSPGHLTGVPSTGGAVMASPAANMSVLLSGHSPVAPVSNASISTFPGGVPPAVPGSNVSMTPPSGAPAAATGFTSTLSIDGVNSFNKVNEAGQWPIMQQQQRSLFPTISVQSSAQQFTPTDGASTNQPWNSSLASSAHVPQVVSKPGQGVSPSSAAQPSPVEVKSSGRKALPEDLFAASFPSYSVPVPGWQTGPPSGMGFAVQYNTAALIPTFAQSSKSMNPFDFNNEQPPAQTPSFPSMASLQGALPNMPPSSGLLRTSSLGAPSLAWMPHQSPAYASALPPQAPTFPSALPPGAYMGQQVPNNIPPSRHQGVGGFGNEGAAFGSIYSNQLQAGGYSAPATPTSFPSVGGNPFG